MRTTVLDLPPPVAESPVVPLTPPPASDPGKRPAGTTVTGPAEPPAATPPRRQGLPKQVNQLRRMLGQVVRSRVS